HEGDTHVLGITYGPRSSDEEQKISQVDFEMHYSDARGLRYTTTYTLVVMPTTAEWIPGGIVNVATGVCLVSRQTTCRPLWMLKLNGKLGGGTVYFRHHEKPPPFRDVD